MMNIRRIHVVHVIHHLVIGGMENGLVNLINQLPESKFRHSIICIEDYSDFRSRIIHDDVQVIALGRSKVGIWRVRWKLYCLYRQLKPDASHSRNLSGLDALLPAWLSGVPVRIHSEHGWDVDDLHGTSKKNQWLRRLHRPFVNFYVALSKSIEGYLTNAIGIPKEKIHVVCNGVDTERFMPATDSERVTPFLGRTVWIGTIGRLQPVKDQESLIRAFSALRKELGQAFEELGLLLVGGGPMLEHLKLVAEQEQVIAQCHFPGPQERTEEWYRRMDVFALPSLNEGISNTLLEAMASGLPVVASAVGGNTELVEDGQSGILVPAADTGALAAALLRYIREPETRKVHGERGRARACSVFSLQNMLSKYADLYQRSAARR